MQLVSLAKQNATISFQHHKRKLVTILQSPSTTLKQLQQIHAQFLLHGPSSHLYFLNSMLFAYARSSAPSLAFAFYATQMHGFTPNHITFQFLLKACSKSKSSVQAVLVHSLTFKHGFGSYTFIQNALTHCYAVCGLLVDAQRVFDDMSQRDIVSFNSLIHGYTESGDMHSALELFSQAPEPNVVTWTAMVVGFASHGDAVEARQLFDQMPERDLVSWNAMISSHMQNRQPVEALHLFRQMQCEHFRPNAITIASVLSACASLGALDTGKWIHLFMKKNKFQLDAFLGTSLIDMYSKCGVVQLALEVFEELRDKNTCTWNAFLNGLAMNGHAKQALEWFNKMRSDSRVRPDEVTFVAILLACSHGGFVEEGKMHFYCTIREYRVPLLVEHYACFVDLLGRAGLLAEAEGIIRSMPIEPDIVIWRALLGGCRLHKNVEIAEAIIKEMEARSSGDYMLLSNLYASVGRWDDLEKVRRSMKDKGIKKVPGCSSIVIDNTIYEFISGDKSHPTYYDILAMLEELGRKMITDGYSAETSSVPYDIDEEEKEQSLGHHSEKLAIALCLIRLPAGSTIRIVKNLRVCNDCHNFTKFISKICNREIVVRDRVRFHHFKDGVCSCNDYW